HGDAVVRVRQRLAEGMNFEPRRVTPLNLFLQRRAETRNLIRSFLRAIPVRPGVPELRAESTQVITAAAGSMVEARHIDMLPTDSPIVARCRTFERGQISARVQPDLFAEVTADHVRPVAKAVRM